MGGELDENSVISKMEITAEDNRIESDFDREVVKRLRDVELKQPKKSRNK